MACLQSYSQLNTQQGGAAVYVRATNTITLADLPQMVVEEQDAIPQQCVTKMCDQHPAAISRVSLLSLPT